MSLFFTGCLPNYIKKVDDPNIPISRPGYTILPPGEEWIYTEQGQTGEYILSFGKPNVSKTFSEVATVTEIYSYTVYESPEDFLSFTKKSMLFAMDPRRFNTLEESITLSDKFGPYCIEFYSKVEDHGARNAFGVPYLIMESMGYHFLHPTIEGLIINIGYSQRGLAEELSQGFKIVSNKFFDGLDFNNSKNKETK